MRDFLKTTLAVITGLIISSILLFFFTMVMFAVMIASASKPVRVSDNTLLKLKIGVPIPDRGNPTPTITFDQQNIRFAPVTGLNDIISNLKKAAEDDRIKGVIIEPGLFNTGWATAGEIRDEIIRFRESGKFVISYTDYLLNQESYYISTAADYIYMNPQATLEFTGLAAEVMFYKNALEKLGVNMQIIRHGTFKGAVEPFMYDRLSRENREQIASYTGSIWNHVTAGIEEARGIPVSELNHIADYLRSANPQEALDLDMIDGLIYRDQLTDTLRKMMNIEEDERIRTISMTNYTKVPHPKAKREERDKIAVIYASGNIVMGSGSDANIGGDRYARIIRGAREDSMVKAIVLRINSPGGSAIASEIIWRELELAGREKPVVVSMGNYAASGGYYIAAPAKKIVTSPSTITGSIGVFGMIPDISELLNEKAGITTEVVRTNRHSDSPSLTRRMTPFETAVMQENIDRVYGTFVDHVSEGRGMLPEEIDRIGQGRVWSGAEALDNGLADESGSLADAIDLAANLADLEKWSIEELPEIVDPYTRLIQELTGETAGRLIAREAGPLAPFLEELRELSETRGIQARLPYHVLIR